MTTMASRQPRREYIATQLASAVTAAQAVYDYLPGAKTLKGKSPVVLVQSGGSGRRFASAAYNPTDMLFYVTILVLHNDPRGGSDEAGAEDTLDTVEQQVAEWVRDNAGPTYSGATKLWDLAELQGRSRALFQEMAGVWFRMETMQLVVRLDPE